MSFLRNNVVCLTKRCRKYFGRTIMSLSIEAFGLGNIFFLSSTPSLAFTTASQPASNRRLISLIKNDDNPPGARPPGPTTAIVPAPTVPPSHDPTNPPSHRLGVIPSPRRRALELLCGPPPLACRRQCAFRPGKYGVRFLLYDSLRRSPSFLFFFYLLLVAGPGC